MTQVIEDMLPVVQTQSGPAVGIPTIRGVKYSEGTTLEQGLNAMNIQIVESAATVAAGQAQLADVISWLTEHFDYQPQPRPTPGSYLTPLFAELMQTPEHTEAAHE